MTDEGGSLSEVDYMGGGQDQGGEEVGSGQEEEREEGEEGSSGESSSEEEEDRRDPTVTITYQNLAKTPNEDPPLRLHGGFAAHPHIKYPNGAGGKPIQRACRVCKWRDGRRRDTRYFTLLFFQTFLLLFYRWYCSKCNIPLCQVADCYVVYHNQKEYGAQ